MNASERVFRRSFWLLVLGITVFRLAIAGTLGLSTDESHYVMYARQPAWGYLDHPPMVGFMGAFFLGIHDSAFFARLGPILCSLGSLVLLRRLALAMYGSERVAFLAALFLLLMPVQHLLGVALLPDATLNLFWCGALLAAWHAMKSGGLVPWLLMGLCFGGALLSKYHGALLPVCLFLHVAMSSATRRWLWKSGPYLAGLIGFLVFLPNVIWNYRHDWISYLFQIGRGGGKGGFELAKVGESLGGQMLAVSPILFVLILAAAIQTFRHYSRSEADRYALWTSLPVVLVFCGIGMAGRILPHWPAVGWWTGSLLLASTVVRPSRPAGNVTEDAAGDADPAVPFRWKGGLVAAGAVAVLMLLVTYSALAYPLVAHAYPLARRITLALNARFAWITPLGEFQPHDDVTSDLHGWDESARAVEAVRASMPNPERTFVCTHRFYTISQIGVFLGRSTLVTSLEASPNQYHLWFVPEKYAGWDAVFVDDNHYPDRMARHAALFERVDPDPVPVDIYRQGVLAHRQRLYRCHGFKGRRTDGHGKQ